jgi:hypothetical protein
MMLPEYSENVLQLFATRDTDPWALEGVDITELIRFGVSHSKSFNATMIPHRDWRGRFVGLRQRNFSDDKIGSFKYMPSQINAVYYRHPISANLYGMYENKDAIIRHRKIILFESEKAVLQYGTMFKDNIALALCGKNISKWQVNIIIALFQPREVVVALDKEYKNFQEGFEYLQELKNKFSYLSLFTDVAIMLDQEERFAMKDSPVDRTKDDFDSMHLFYI